MLYLYPVHDLFLFYFYFGCWQSVSHVRLWKLLYSVIITYLFFPPLSHGLWIPLGLSLELHCLLRSAWHFTFLPFPVYLQISMYDRNTT